MLVEHVEVGLDPGGVGFGHPRVAVAGVAGGAVGAQSTDTQRQPQHAFAQGLDVRMGRDRLETGIQQRRVHAVSVLLRADWAGQRDLGQHGAGCRLAGVHGGQTGERRTVLNTTLVQALAHLGAVLAARMRGKQRGDVVARVAAHPRRRAGPRWLAALVRPPDSSPRRSRRRPAMTTTPRRRPWSAHRAAASARSGCRGPRPPRRARRARRPAPSRSRPPPEARPHCGSGDRPARAAPRCRPRPARRGAPAPPASAHARPTADAPKRCNRRASGDS